MIPLAASILVLSLAATLDAQTVDRACPPLNVRNPDGNYIVPGVKGDIPFSGDLALDAYIQRGPGPRPTVVVIHGGGWTAGSRIAHVGQILELLTRGGYHWFSVDYRLGGLRRIEDALADLRAALAFIRCRAGELGIDPAQLVLLGEDAGAHLAALLAAERPAGLIGTVLLGGFYDLRAIKTTASVIENDAAWRISPMSQVSQRVPPLLVVHGGADTESPVEDARRFCTGVDRGAGRCQLVEVAGASHRT